jgi:hypothetical protein
MSSLQQNWRKGQNRFCLEVRGVGERGREWEVGGKNDPNNVCTYEYMNKEKKQVTEKKPETSQIHTLMMHLKLLEKQEQTKPKTSRWREITKIRGKINEIKTKQTIQTTHETKKLALSKD